MHIFALLSHCSQVYVCAAQCHINSFKTQRACSVKIAAAAAVRHKGCTASKGCGGEGEGRVDNKDNER